MRGTATIALLSATTITPLRTEGPAPRVLTIDAEDWFHICGDDYYSDPSRWDTFAPRVERTLGGLLETLEVGRHRATVFFLGWIADRYPALVKEAVRRGHEVGVHGDLHRRADEMTTAQFREDLLRARDRIESAGGRGATAYRAAEWSIRHARSPALAELAAAGFQCDASMMPVPPLGSSSNPLGPHRIARDGWSLIEIPPLTGRAFGLRLPMGGAWPFRILSERRLAAAERAFRQRGDPAVFTFHPWEFDDSHPAMPGLSPIARAVHFLGLRKLPERFTRWLAGDRCVAIEDALSRLRSA